MFGTVVDCSAFVLLVAPALCQDTPPPGGKSGTFKKSGFNFRLENQAVSKDQMAKTKTIATNASNHLKLEKLSRPSLVSAKS